MYLHKLEKDEKTTFLSFARHLAKVDDNKIDDRERYMLRYMMAEMGLNDADVAPAYSAEHVVNVFHRPVARRVLILEGMGIAASNGSIDATQRKLLEDLAAKFSLPADYVARAQATITKQLEVMAEFENLLK